MDNHQWLEAAVDPQGHVKELWLYDKNKVSRASKPIPVALHELFDIQAVSTKAIANRPPTANILTGLPMLIREVSDAE